MDLNLFKVQVSTQKLKTINMAIPTKKGSTASHNGKGFLALAGEAFSVLGEEIVEGKDKVMEVASEKFTAVKKAVKKKFAHKKAPVRSIKKKAVSAGKAAVKKVAAKKSVVKKAVAAPKKAAKKAIAKKR